MAKSGDGKVKASETATEKKLHEYDGRAQVVPAEEASESDPLDTQNRAQNARFQLAESLAAHEPDGLQWIDDARTVRWDGLLGAQLQLVGSEATQPGGQAERPKPVPKQERIQTANELAESVHKLVHTAVAPNRWEKELNAARKTAVFGERPAPSSRAGWTTELTLVHGGIVTLGAAAPAALGKLLPRIEAALAALAGSKAQPTGRPPKSPAYSAQVIVAAISLDLMLGDLLAWATSEANEKRYGSLARAIAPKRRSDAKPDAGSKGDGSAAGADGAKGEGAASSAAGSNGSAPAAPTEPKNGAAGSSAQA